MGPGQSGPELPLVWRGLLVLAVSWNPANMALEIIFLLNTGKPSTVGWCWLPNSICIVPWLLQTRGRFKSKLHSATDSFVGLTVEQKYELAERELTEMKDEIEKMNEDLGQTLQNLEVRLSRLLMVTNVSNSLVTFLIPQAVRQTCLVGAVDSRALP